MPELPEVETTRLGLMQALPGKVVTAVVVRESRLRQPVPDDLDERIIGQTLRGIERRGKYLLFRFARGTLIGHLGMSGSMRVLPTSTAPEKHDHVDIVFGAECLRLRDPRRFGSLVWAEGDPQFHPSLIDLGPEPLEPRFDADYLYQSCRTRKAAIKLVIMDSHVVVGVGNIYASESLYRAGVRPTRAAYRLSRVQCAKLVDAIKATLTDALAAGGSTLRDFFSADGSPGYFQQHYFVYGREGQPCRRCDATIKMIRQGQRATYYCPQCQPA